MRNRALAVLAAGALVLAGCAKGGGAPQSQATQPPAMPTATSESKVASIKVGGAADSQGPATEVSGAKRGGTITGLFSVGPAHLDPGQIYYSDQSQIAGLISRGLIGFKQQRDGNILIVGDLATDTGTSSDGGKTWTFTLKDGVKWEDGSPVTSEDVKWSFERLYDPVINQGPTYIQQWLVGSKDYRAKYPGPYKSGEGLKTIETPDAKTVVFHLDKQHGDFNMALGMPGYAIVPKKHTQDVKDEKNYDKRPHASGPYRIVKHTPDKSMEMERNPNWDPATDPIRNAYPDRWTFEFGVTVQQATDRFIADSGEDQYAVNIFGLGPERLPEVVADPELMKRAITGITPFTEYWAINTKRITDPKVREALIRAWPTGAIHKLAGGDMGFGYLGTTIMSPTGVGFRKFDVWGQLDKPDGDVEAARKLLAEAGEQNPTIVYAYANRPLQQKIAVLVQEALTKAGFKYVGKEIDANSWGDTIGQVDKAIDVHRSGWGADWPDGQTVLPPLFDGRLVADGASNYSNYDNPEVNKAIDEADKLATAEERGAAWSKIDEMIVKDAALIPGFYLTYIDMRGSKVWAEMDYYWGGTNLLTAYVNE